MTRLLSIRRVVFDYDTAGAALRSRRGSSRRVFRSAGEIEEASEHPATQLERLGEDEARPVAVRRLAPPLGELLFRPEEVEPRSEEARQPVAAPLAPLDPREAAGRRPAGARHRIDVEDERRAAPVAA
jgi:hypothetical protein